jgi:hypothetical protein
MHKKTLADIRPNLSIIVQVMHNELIYQAKIHTISAKLLKEKIKFCLFSPIFFFFNEKE